MDKEEFKVIDLGKEAYLKPDAYLNGWARHLGWKATLVFDCLCRHADRHGEAFPSAKLMAEKLGVSPKSVYRGIKALTEWNIIQKGQKRSKKGKFLHNTYKILHKRHWKQPPLDSGGKRTVGLHRQSPLDSSDNHRRTVRDMKVLSNKDTHKKEGELSVHALSQRLFSFYEEKYLELVSDKKPVFNQAKCEKLARPHLKRWGLEKMKRLLIRYFVSDDEIFESNAYSLSCFLATSTLHRLNQKTV